MKQLNKAIKVTTIMPYYINTGMFEGVQSKIPILKPEDASLKIVKAIDQNKRMVTLPGYIYRLARLGQAIKSINTFDWFAGKVLGIYKTMEHFLEEQRNNHSFGIIGNTIAGVFGNILFIKSFGRLGINPTYIIEHNMFHFGLFISNCTVSFIGGLRCVFNF